METNSAVRITFFLFFVCVHVVVRVRVRAKVLKEHYKAHTDCVCVKNQGRGFFHYGKKKQNLAGVKM